MDISIKKKNANIPWTMHTILSIVFGLIGFFTLTKEDRLKAGIYIDKNGK